MNPVGITLLMLAAFGGFFYLAWRKLAIVLSLAPEVRWDAPLARLARLVKNGFLQARMRAEERLAIFLLNLSQRYQDRGYSPTAFVLRLTRQDIGSYLGIQLETVSRLLSRFQAGGLIQVQGRVVQLLDIPALKQMAGR